jgi:endonuclease/exonuclease/phosphatase family metal-dependent hydrolase
VTSVSAPIRVLSWNVQGSRGLDVDAAARLIGAWLPDVVVLQEVQRRQTSRLASALGMPSHRWFLKHWPVLHRAEGLAVLTPHRLVSSDGFTLRRAAFWSWRRRIAVDVTVDTGDVVARLLDVHLSPHGDRDRRLAEAHMLIDRAGAAVPPPVIVGDLNELPRQGAHAELVGAGWVDAWSRLHGDAPGATNWTVATRVGAAPSQRIDYVLAPSGSVVEDAAVLAEPLDLIAALSDHLPVVAMVRLPEPGRIRR